MISQYNWTNLYNSLDIKSATELFYSVRNSYFCECVSDSFPPKLNFHKKYKKSGRPSSFSRHVVARTNFNVLNSHCYSMYLKRCKFEFSKDPWHFLLMRSERLQRCYHQYDYTLWRHLRIPKLQIYLRNSSNLLIVLFPL